MSANNTQARQPAQHLSVDFSHRLSVFNSAEFNTQNSDVLIDSISLMTDRASGILYLLAGQFEDEGGRLSDKLLCGVIDAAIHEVEDIKATLMAFCEAEHAKNQAQKNPEL